MSANEFQWENRKRVLQVVTATGERETTLGIMAVT